jgi:hypothetical protein
MPLISRLSPTESIRRFRAAAILRYREACCLAINEERLGALYLSGYSAEMLLKAAYFRLISKGLDDPITRTDFDAARTTAVKLGILRGRNLHDLRWWQDLLIQFRGTTSRPFQPTFARELASKVQSIDQNWIETLRYRTNRPSKVELCGAMEAVQWLIGRYRHL